MRSRLVEVSDVTVSPSSLDERVSGEPKEDILQIGVARADSVRVAHKFGGAVDGGGVSYHKDEQGNYVKTRLDEGSLQEMALETEGDYFRSTLVGKELEAIYGQIAQMEQKDIGSSRLTRYEERFQWPLLAALVCFLAEALLGDARVRSREWKGRFA